MLVCLQLAKRGGAVESVDITACTGETITMPNGAGKQHTVPGELVENLLGRSFTDDEIHTAISVEWAVGLMDVNRHPTMRPSLQTPWRLLEQEPRN